MSHKPKVGQAVVPAYREVDSAALYQIVSLMPLCSTGKPQYLIRCRRGGTRGRFWHICHNRHSSAGAARGGARSNPPGDVPLTDEGLPAEEAARRAMRLVVRELRNDPRFVPLQGNPRVCLMCGEPEEVTHVLGAILTPKAGEFLWIHLNACHAA